MNNIVATNRKAKFDYELSNNVEAGIQLQGSEIKAIREHKGLSLQNAYVSIDSKNEIWIENLNIPKYEMATWTNHAPTRKRKLLLHKSEILKFRKAVKESRSTTIIPLKMSIKNGLVKVEIALAKGKKLWDKRQTIRKREDKLEQDRALKAKNR
jgi:SsrA-binding protein